MNDQAYLAEVRELQSAHWPAGAAREAHYPHGEQPISAYLTAWAQVNPDKPALHFYGYDLTYAQLDALSNRFANLLRDLGVQPGDGVALFMPNCPQFHIAYFGIFKCGAVHVPVSPLAKAMELRHQLGDSQPKVVLCLDALLPVLQPVADE